MTIIQRSASNKCWEWCWEEGALLHCWWECKFVQQLWRTVWRFLKKLKIELPYDPAILLLGIYPEKTLIWKDTCTPVFNTTLTWTQSTCPLTGDWIEKMWYLCINTMKYYSDIKNNEIMLFAAKWMDLEIIILSEVQFSWVAQSCPTLCDPMKRRMPGLPVHHQLPEFTQTHVHRVSDAIQPCHPLSSLFPPAPNPSQHQSLFQWVNSSHEVAKLLEFQLQHHSVQRYPRADLLQNGLVGSPCSPRDSQESSPTPQFKNINSSARCFLYSPTLTSIHVHWKNHSLD